MRFQVPLEDCESPNQRDRYGNHGNDRRPPGLQEQEHDADHKSDSNEDGLDDFVNGLAHEGRWVVDVQVIEARGKVFLSSAIFAQIACSVCTTLEPGVAMGYQGAEGYLSA